MESKPATNLFLKDIYMSKRIARTFSKNKAADRRRKELLLHQKVVDAQIRLEGDPQSVVCQVVLVEVKSNMKIYMENKSRWMLEVA